MVVQTGIQRLGLDVLAHLKDTKTQLRVGFDDLKLILGQFTSLVEQFQGYGRLTQIMHQACHPGRADFCCIKPELARQCRH